VNKYLHTGASVGFLFTLRKRYSVSRAEINEENNIDLEK